MLCQKPFVKQPTPKQIAKGKVLPQAFPCGRCLACRIAKQSELKHRILLEQLGHENSCFITLTYDDEHFPPGANLEPHQLQKYWKRLRKAIYPIAIRYLAVGEYGFSGERIVNPHYHAAVFGIGPEYGNFVDRAWGLGFSYTGDLNKDTASYIAGYCLKGLTRRDDPRLEGRMPQFFRGSRRDGGIGLPGVKKIAEKLEKTRGWKPKAIRQIQYGKNKTLPLGRYLTEKLNSDLGTTELLQDEKEAYHLQQVEIATRDLKKGWAENIVEDKKQTWKRQLKRHKIFRQKRGL